MQRSGTALSLQQETQGTLGNLGEDVSLSSYVSRHSWATAARNNNVSLTVISEGLGHSSERMTRIYLGNFNTELIDKANRALMHRMRLFVSMRETNN